MSALADPNNVRRNGLVSDLSRAADVVPPSWGEPLTEDDYAALAKSWITKEIADLAMLRRVDRRVDGRQIVGQKGKRDCAGILIPYYIVGGVISRTATGFAADNPEWTLGKDGKPKQERKYLGAPGSPNRLYFPPGVTPEQLADVTIPVVIVEGEKKALALQRLACHETARPRFIPVAIPGVWNWRGTVGKANGPKGERIDLKGPINDLNWDLSGRVGR